MNADSNSLSNPPTTRDGTSVNPPTTRDGASVNPPTTRDGASVNPPTTRDAGPYRSTASNAADAGAASAENYIRVNLPPALRSRFEVVRELSSSTGEADILLCRGLEDGAEVAVKYYHSNRTTLDPSTIAALERIDSPRIIRVYERTQYPQGWVEIMEYVPGGSVADRFAAARRVPWDPENVRLLIVQMADALHDLHELHLIHRDVKPANILIRPGSRPDLVLTDFGIASAIEGTRAVRTTSRTVLYAAPEAAYGDVSAALDWWPLGVMALELLTGRHPFTMPNGEPFPDAQIAVMVNRDDIDVSTVDDKRWRLLLRGLLTRSPRRRWGERQVREWLAGGSPAVHEVDAPDAPQAGHQRTVHHSTQTFVFNRRAFTRPTELAQALAQDWQAGMRLVTGIGQRAPQSTLLLEWLQQAGLDRTATQLRDATPNRGLVLLITALDPDAPPRFAGADVSVEGLVHHLQEAGREAFTGPTTDLLVELARAGALGIYGRTPAQSDLAIIDEQWQRSLQSEHDYLSALPADVQQSLSPAVTKGIVVQLLGAAIRGDRGDDVETVASNHRHGLRMEIDWYADLLDGRSGGDPVARSILLPVLSARADELGAEQRWRAEEAAERNRQQELARQEWERRDRRFRAPLASPVLAFVFALILPPLGAFLGVRSMRSRYGVGLFNVLAVVIGIVATIAYLNKLTL